MHKGLIATGAIVLLGGVAAALYSKSIATKDKGLKTVAVTKGSVVEKALAGHVRLVWSNVIPAVRRQLDRYGITAAVGEDAYYDTSGEVLAVFGATTPDPGDDGRPGGDV